jgi:hypothetical protein
MESGRKMQIPVINGELILIRPESDISDFE